MKFPIHHYGVQFRIDVVEAETEMIVGSALLTTQGILQEQRDMYIAQHGASVFQFLKGPIPFVGKRKLKLELRSGIKPGKMHDFFSLPTKSGGPNKTAHDQVGSVSGWIEINVGIEEFYSRLYGSDPIECPNRPPADLNISNFSVHIARIKTIVGDLNRGIAHYNYMISWKNPPLTAIAMYIFVTFCLRFDTEYSGSLPFLFLLLIGAYCAYRRGQFRTKSRYIQEELETIQRVEGSSVGYTVYRPKGTVTAAVTKGRNLLSKDLGIAGRVSCHVYLDQTRYAPDEKIREKIILSDRSAELPLEIGRTTTLYTAHPDWNDMKESPTNKRLKQLLPSSDRNFFEASSLSFGDDKDEFSELTFPVLQPFEITGTVKDDKGRFVDGKLKPWESSKAAIVVQVKFQDFLNNLPGFDHSLGEIVFPFSELAKNGEIKGWFQILDVGTNIVCPLDDHDLDGNKLDGTSGPHRLYLDLKWAPSSAKSVSEPDDSERELSYVADTGGTRMVQHSFQREQV
jgi:hypothetical protein